MKVSNILKSTLLFSIMFPTAYAIDQGTITEAIRSLLPEGYFVMAEGFGLPESGAIIIFGIIWVLVSGIVWLASQKIFSGEYGHGGVRNGIALISVSMGALVAYGIGIWAPEFLITVSILALLTIFFVGLSIFRGLRGFSASIGRFEMEMRKLMSQEKKEFLEAERELKQVEADYKMIYNLLEREFGWKLKDNRVRKLFNDLQNMIPFVRKAIMSGDPHLLNKARIEIQMLKKELEYVAALLPHDAKSIEIIKMLENNLNRLERSISRAAKDEIRLIQELKKEVLNQIANFDNKLNEIDNEIKQLEQKLQEDINQIRKQYVNTRSHGRFKANVKREISKLNEMISEVEERIKTLSNYIYTSMVMSLNVLDGLLELGKENEELGRKLEELKEEYKRELSELKKEYQEFEKIKKELEQRIDNIEKGYVKKEDIQMILNKLTELFTKSKIILEKHKNIQNYHKKMRAELSKPSE